MRRPLGEIFDLPLYVIGICQLGQQERLIICRGGQEIIFCPACYKAFTQPFSVFVEREKNHIRPKSYRKKEEQS